MIDLQLSPQRQHYMQLTESRLMGIVRYLRKRVTFIFGSSPGFLLGAKSKLNGTGQRKVS